ncbi:unnamed protein product [Urochloa humidicola]
MASRFLLHARAGAYAAARSVRGHRGQILTPRAFPTVMADAGSCAGTIPAIQGLCHYGTPSNRQNVAELNEALRKVERRLDVLEEKYDAGHKPSMKDIFKKYKNGHKDVGSMDITKEFRQITNGVMVVGFSLTLGVVVYYHFF